MRISLFSGRGTELVPGLTSAIHKQPISAPVRCTFAGLEGDEQCDLRHVHPGNLPPLARTSPVLG